MVCPFVLIEAGLYSHCLRVKNRTNVSFPCKDYDAEYMANLGLKYNILQNYFQRTG